MNSWNNSVTKWGVASSTWHRDWNMIHAIALACLVLWPQAGSLYIAGGHNGQKARPRHVEVTHCQTNPMEEHPIIPTLLKPSKCLKPRAIYCSMGLGSNMLCFQPYLERWSELTNMFQGGWKPPDPTSLELCREHDVKLVEFTIFFLDELKVCHKR